MKRKATKASSRLDDLTFGTFSVRTAAVSGVNGIGHIDTVRRPCAAKDCEVICRRPNQTKHPKSWYLDTASISEVIPAGSEAGKGNKGLD